ncbi:MAG: hypothetical protein R3B07_04515 [Polyangiaceae bacterium]
MGPLCALLVLRAEAIRTDLFTAWREQARAGLQQLRDCEDEELGFQEPYYANVDRLFAALLS